ncbi:MAG: GTP-binding protein, partial [Gammaproteobacteria bacterium]|nr:GTP-binding protein [Gammaproteobacteria bacterium]
GFLGSGKTTLLNRLLADEGMAETAVLINEFGEIGLDHLLVQEVTEGVVLLSSGCICCTVQGELVDSLRELYLDRIQGAIPNFNRVMIETTGLADPAPVIGALVRDPMFK